MKLYHSLTCSADFLDVFVMPSWIASIRKVYIVLSNTRNSLDMPEEKGLDLLNKCIKEAKRRFVANLVGYKIVVIDKNGYRKLADVNF